MRTSRERVEAAKRKYAEMQAKKAAEREAREKQAATPSGPVPPGSSPPTARDQMYAQAALDARCQVLRTMARDTGRNEAVNRAAYAIMGYGVLSREEIEAALYAAAEANDLVADTSERAVRASIRSGLDAGEKKPRDLPPEKRDRPQSRSPASHSDRKTTFLAVPSSEFAPEGVEYLMYPQIPKGKLVIFSGPTDVGKTAVAIDIAARITRGEAWPDSLTPEGSVLFISNEDGKADTLVPRLMAAGADLKKLHFLTSPIFEQWSVGRFKEIVGEIQRIKAELLIVDPILEFLGTDANSYQDVKQTLGPLMAEIDKLGVTIIGINHFRKGASHDVKDRSTGSVAIQATARVLVTFHKDHDGAGLMAVAKGNLVPDDDKVTLKYRLEKVELGDDKRGRPISAPKVHWLGVDDRTAAQLNAEEIARAHAATSTKDDDAPKLSLAMEMIRAELADGETHDAVALKQQVMTKASCSKNTYGTALAGLRKDGELDVARDGFGPGSRVRWRLTTQSLALYRERLGCMDGKSVQPREITGSNHTTQGKQEVHTTQSAIGLYGGPPKALTSSASNEWYTPASVIAIARKVLGRIELDPATCALANEVVKAEEIFTIDDDGLSKPWRGRVWCNPPYGRTDGKSNQALWSAKMIEEFESGRIHSGLLLVNANLGSSWFQSLHRYPICIVRGRIPFYGPDGDHSAPTHESALVYFGEDEDWFVKVAADLGEIKVPRAPRSDLH